ncbi:hypothetical protein MPSEU_000365100 [Mayamaea pseudoterrestris]|nr:hypothetical protein MPSEU_000365100 [Mayamaea pseudoterrestris]
MDRFAAMIILLGGLVTAVLVLLALFTIAPITCSCLVSLLYTLYLFIAYEESGLHYAQEFENRFWTGFGVLLSTALFFAADSPVAFGLYSPGLGLIGIVLSGYFMHVWDRYTHRISISQQTNIRRSSTANTSLIRLRDLGIPVEEQLDHINSCLQEIDQLLIPSTINNFINQRFVLLKEREIITVFEECDARALNYLIGHVKLGLLFYKIKDHRHFNGKNRTELINLLAIERLPILSVVSRVIILHSLQLLKLRANPRAEHWVRNILLKTHQDELSELKTLMDAKGDYFCMNKLIYDDIRSESVRQDILNHIRREAAIQQTNIQMGTRRARHIVPMQWRKVLSDVDDTLYCSGGMYPAGVDRRYPRKTVYPGVLGFYRELDIGTQGPEEWKENSVGNLVFLSARPHLYKDISEKINFAKFEKLRTRRGDGRQGLHTMPSLLAGDLTSGSQFLYQNDFEPLAKKKFDNFRRYVSIYPEYQHVFVCDNGQGDVRAGELMWDAFPYEFETLFVHVVQDIRQTYGYAAKRWREKEFRGRVIFFRNFVEAALRAANQNPPMIRIRGLRRICSDAAKDFMQINNWTSDAMKSSRRHELNQSLWEANCFLTRHCEQPADLIQADPRYFIGEKVRTPYGLAIIRGFDPTFDLYQVELDWRPLHIQVAEYLKETKDATIRPKNSVVPPLVRSQTEAIHLETVDEVDEGQEDDVLASSTDVETSGLCDLVSEQWESHVNTQPVVSEAQSVGESSQESGQPSSEASAAGGRRDIPVRSCSDGAIETGTQSLSADQSGTLRAICNMQALLKRDEKGNVMNGRGFVHASVHGQFISKHTAPTLPKFSDKSRASLFPFLQTPTPKCAIFKAGDECTTPYGPGRIVELREKKGCVVVEMVNWHATGYMRLETVKHVSHSLFSKLVWQLSLAEKPLDFPYADGTIINTPFGKGRVFQPLPPTRPRGKKAAMTPTIGMRLENWKLANGAHPQLFCTVESARGWKDKKAERPSIFSSAIEQSTSAIGKMVESSRTLLSPLLVKKNKPLEPKLSVQYYKDSASVSTLFGDGVIKAFRSVDGFYEVSLSQCALANGSFATAFLRKNCIRHRVAVGCQEGE